MLNTRAEFAQNAKLGDSELESSLGLGYYVGCDNFVSRSGFTCI